jgi:carboxypeptidase Q
MTLRSSADVRALLAALLMGAGLTAPPPAAVPLGAASAPGNLTAAQLDAARALRDRALADDVGYEFLRSLTTEIGPRPAGSVAGDRAVAWALAKLKALGFSNVHAESVWVPHWIRGEARAEIVSPWPQRLMPVALGGCPATSEEGVEADVVPVTTLEELLALPSGRVRGKIVFFTARMARTRDTEGYSRAVVPRSKGAWTADSLGAVGMVMRNAGTSNNRLGHTGEQSRDKGNPRIPGMALSHPDADLLEQELASGRPVRLRLWNTSQWADSVRSANVVGEIPDRDPQRSFVLLGAHLDSWDLGTGAHDDGAGLAIVTAAARLIGQAKPAARRSLRVVFFANEEFGLSGARSYARVHQAELPRCALALESDLGAYAPWGLECRVPVDRLPLVKSMLSVIEPLGIEFNGNQAGGGADIGRLRDLGVPVMEVDTDAAPYFDLHHTANDTFDKIDPTLLRRNIAALAAIVYLAGQAEGGFGRLEIKQP